MDFHGAYDFIARDFDGDAMAGVFGCVLLISCPVSIGAQRWPVGIGERLWIFFPLDSGRHARLPLAGNGGATDKATPACVRPQIGPAVAIDRERVDSGGGVVVAGDRGVEEFRRLGLAAAYKQRQQAAEHEV
ncbi:hypothetical protein D3C78_1566470 [compost metagenome]